MTTTQSLVQELMKLPLERILSIGITGSGKSYQWLRIAKRLKSVGAKFRVVDTDNDILYMLHTEFPELLPENGGNVYVCPAYDWPEYEKAVNWIQQIRLTTEQLGSMDKYLVSAYKTPVKPIDWVVADKSNNAWKTVQDYFVGEVFGESTGEYFLEVRKRLHEAGDIGKSGKPARSTILEGLDGWKDWCLTPDTEILTQRGWKNYDSLVPGENVLVLLPDSWKYRWEPLLDIHVGHSKSRKMIRLEGASHSSLTTLDHRWLVEACVHKQYNPVWRTSETLKTFDRIPMCALPLEANQKPVYSNALVEVVAWYVTEGGRSEREHRQQLQGAIYQSVKHKGEVERIRAAIRQEFGVIKEGVKDDDIWVWYLPGRVMSILEEVAPNKCPTYEFLLKLTQEQLQIFVEVCMLGDGSIRETGQKSFMQNRKDIVDAFEFACILQGIAIRTWPRISGSRLGKPEYYQVSVLKSKGAWPVNAAQQAPYQSSARATRTIVDHEGIVWCPVTPSGTWLAKRRGTIYFTGNSVINKLYSDWINPIVYRVKCHVYATADVDSLDKNEKDPEILSLYGDLRIKAAGQKAIGGQMHTILLLIPGSDRWLVTTVKDRANRQYFKKTPLVDLYTQYLFAKAGWPLIESGE